MWYVAGIVGLLVVGMFLGVLIAANNEGIAKWISKKVSDKIDKKR